MVTTRASQRKHNLVNNDDNHPDYSEDLEEPNNAVNEDLEEPNNAANVNEAVPGNEIVMDYTNIFTNTNYFPTRDALQEWVRHIAMQNDMVITVKRSDSGGGKKNARVFLSCERGGKYRGFKGKRKRKRKKEVIKQATVDNDEGEKKSSKGRDSGTKKCGCPFLLKGTQISLTEWMLEVKCGIHNHPIATYLTGHSYAGRLTPQEEEFVVDMSHSNAQAKDVLRMLKKKNADNRSTIRTIYNARKKHRVTEYGGRSQLQYLMGLLDNNGYVQHNRRCQDTNTVRELFFAHPTSIKLFRAFPSILLIDYSYKANRYRLPCLEMVGVTSTGMTFSVASVFLQAEKEDNYMWALGMLRDVLDDACLPKVIIADQEKALMNAIASKFPEATHFLCTKHINKNVLAKCKEKFKTKESWDAFYSSWKNVMFAETEEELTDAIRVLHEDYATVPLEYEAVEYVMNQWVTPYKEKFISVWTNQVMHYENTTTNRVESHHSTLKKMLGHSLGNLEMCWGKINTLFGASHTAIKHSFEKSVNLVQPKFSPIIFNDLRGVVSNFALDKLYDEMKRMESGKSDPLTCKHYLRKVCGLPCPHEIAEYHRLGQPIPVDAVDRFWKKLDMEPMLRDDVGDDIIEDIDNRFENVIHALVGHYKNVDASEKMILLRQAVKLANPVTICQFGPEPMINTCSSPKAKALKKQIIRRRTQSATPENFISLLPAEYQPYIVECKNVNKDGHCGFRAVAGLMGFGEDKWVRVRQDLMNELSHHLHLYQGAFGEKGRVVEILDSLNCFTESAPFNNWFQLPYMGYLVASAYNVAFITLSNDISLTFLPLRSALPERPRSICMSMVNSNHFIQVKLAVERPMPVVASSWEHHHLRVADGWKVAYDNRQIN